MSFVESDLYSALVRAVMFQYHVIFDNIVTELNGGIPTMILMLSSPIMFNDHQGFFSHMTSCEHPHH